MGFRGEPDFDAFLDELLESIKGMAAKGKMVFCDEVLKNNDTVMTRIIVRRKEDNITPVVYAEDLYMKYLSGISIHELAKEVILICAGTGANSLITEDSLTFEKVKDKIIFNVVSRSANKRLLNDVPHDVFMDLAVIYSCLMIQDDNNIGTIRVTNSLLKQWNVDRECIKKSALANTKKLLPYRIAPMSAAIAAIIDGETMPAYKESDFNREKMYLLTNSAGVGGASCILYDGVLEELYSMYKKDFAIIPSSIHELLFVPIDEAYDNEEMTRVINEINFTAVSKNEVLSGHPYTYYDVRESVKKFLEN